MTKERKNCRASIEKMMAAGQCLDMIIDTNASKYMRIQGRKMKSERYNTKTATEEREDIPDIPQL